MNNDSLSSSTVLYNEYSKYTTYIEIVSKKTIKKEDDQIIPSLSYEQYNANVLNKNTLTANM